MKKIRKVTFHAGHNPSGKIACGASDLLDESTEARYITRKIIKLLKKNSIKAVNCTVNNGMNQGDVLRKICAKCNAVKDADLHISIHFNSGRGDKKVMGELAVQRCCLQKTWQIKVTLQGVSVTRWNIWDLPTVVLKLGRIYISLTTPKPQQY